MRRAPRRAINEGVLMRTTSRACPCCHGPEFDIVKNATYGYIALCCDCGYALVAHEGLPQAS
jgi:hypothetical protein